MTIVVRKNATYIAAGVDGSAFHPPAGYDPAPNFNDKTSGMQPATVNGVIGSAPGTAGVNVAGQTIGAANTFDGSGVNTGVLDYHSSVAINV